MLSVIYDSLECLIFTCSEYYINGSFIHENNRNLFKLVRNMYYMQILLGILLTIPKKGILYSKRNKIFCL